MLAPKKKLIEDWPPELWDNLPELFFTVRSLREFDRRARPQHRAKIPDSSRIKADEQQQLAKFARCGGPDLSDIVQLAIPPSTANKEQSQLSQPRHQAQAYIILETITYIKNISPYDRHFEELIRGHGVDTLSFKDPSNWAEVLQAMRVENSESDNAPQFSTERFQEIQLLAHNATSEADVMRDILPNLTGEVKLPHARNHAFTRMLPVLTVSNWFKLVAPQPDFFDGLESHSVHPIIRHQLEAVIAGSRSPLVPVLPTFFLEVKGPEGNSRIAGLQAIHDGIAGARAMLCLNSFASKANSVAFDGNAYVIVGVLTVNPLTLMLWAVSAEPPNKGQLADYSVRQLGCWSLTKSPAEFRSGVMAFRQARLWAHQQRLNAVLRANAVAEAGLGIFRAPTPPPEEADCEFIAI